MGLYYWYSSIMGYLKRADVKRWLEEISEGTLRRVGIKEGQVLLDFGCGMGYYTIPSARIVGREGRVYAIDKDKDCLDRIKKIAREEGLNNIDFINTAAEVRLPLRDESIDVVLLYDVLHSHYFTRDKRSRLLKEIYRVSKKNALISVYPKHMKLDEIKMDMEKADFLLKGELILTLIHDNSLIKDHLLNFKKVSDF